MINVSHLSQDEKDWTYNCLDVFYTREVGEAETQNIAALGLIEQDAFQQKMFWPVLEAMKRGVRIDTKRRDQMAEELLHELSEREAWFQRVLGHPLNPRSAPQMTKLFYTDLGMLAQRKRGKFGVPGGLTCDDEAMRKMAYREPLLLPLLRKIAEYRSLGVFLSTFVNARLDIDGRMRCSYNICGTETFRLSSSENAFGSGCFPEKSAEVLTRCGWKLIEEISKDEWILAYDPTHKFLRWQPAIPHTENFSGNLVEAKTEQYYTKVTPGHKILAAKAGTEQWRDFHAGALSCFSSRYTIPTGGLLQGGHTHFSAEKLLVAALADGSYEDTRVRFSFKKTRKSERLIELCNDYDIELHETYTSRDGYRRFWFRKPEDWPVEKRWGRWILDLTPIAAIRMLKEISYWDAHTRGESFIFYSADKEQAELVQTLAHIAGFGATLRIDEQNEGSYSTTTMYCVNVKPRETIGVEGKHWRTVFYEGKVYCVTVPSSYFLVRQGDLISITGNTNLQNVPKGGDDEDDILKQYLTLPNIRELFIPDPEHTMFDTDLSKADLNIVTWESGCKEMKELLKAGEDPYIIAAREYYRDPTIVKIKPDGNIHPKYDQFKRFSHGTNYLGTPHGLSQRIGLSVHEADRAQKWYFGKFPEIKRWHERVIDQLKTKHFVQNVFGNRRYYFDRIEDSTFREAIAWIPQSTVALYINHIWLNLWEKYRWLWVLMQVHDSLVGQFPTYRKQEALGAIKDASNIILPYPNDPLIIKLGVKTSEKSWGACG